MENLKHTYEKREVKRYAGYFIDTNGIVWSYIGWRGNKERKLKASPNFFGYLRVSLKTENGRKTEFVHNLMIENFIGNKEGLMVRHLDGNKINNSLDNLVLGTAKENAEDRDLHNKTAKGELHAELIQLRKENARLKREIASAPELLEALMIIINDDPTFLEIDKVRIAIEKATK